MGGTGQDVSWITLSWNIDSPFVHASADRLYDRCSGGLVWIPYKLPSVSRQLLLARRARTASGGNPLQLVAGQYSLLGLGSTSGCPRPWIDDRRSDCQAAQTVSLQTFNQYKGNCSGLLSLASSQLRPGHLSRGHPSREHPPQKHLPWGQPPQREPKEIVSGGILKGAQLC